jgi:hypothetical protein
MYYRPAAISLYTCMDSSILMEAPVTFETREKYLLVTGHGQRNSLSSMVEASEMIFHKLHETGKHYLLVDYTRLVVNVHMTDAFNIVKRYETAQPELKNILIACAFNPSTMEFGKYWKEIGQKRGFSIEVFEDIAMAESWLLGHITN